MNNFTRFELETIYLDMTYNIIKCGKSNIDKSYLDLRDKIERMIHDYCGHSKTHVEYSDDEDGASVLCSDCGCVIKDVD